MAAPINNTYVQKQNVINQPGGGNTSIQYNQNGSFAGDTGLRYAPTTKELIVQGNINAGGWLKGKIYTNKYNFFLDGGTAGQVLSTDGTGNLTWVNQSGGGGSGTNYSNSNVSAYLATFTGNVAAGNIKTDHLLYANGVAWDFAGTYANSNVANYLPTYSGSISPSNLHVTTNTLLGDNSTSGQYYVYRDTNQVSIGQYAAQSIDINSYGISIAGTGGVDIQGVAGANISIGGGTTGNVKVPKGITFADGTYQNTAATSGASLGNLAISGTAMFIAEGASEDVITITPQIEGWAFLQLPLDASANTANTRLWNGAGNVEIGAGDFANDGNSYSWYFKNNGELQTPDGTIIGAVEGANTFGFYNSNPNTQFLLEASSNVWTFDGATGNITLPTNTSSINYANGSPYGGGGGANTGNVTFDGNVVQGTASYTGLGLSASPDDTANLKYLQVRAGDIDSHIHFDTGNYQAYDQYFGDDNKYLKLEAGLAGNVKIGTYQDGGIGQLHWTFDSNGNLVLPENGRIKAAGNTLPFNTGIVGIDIVSSNVYVTASTNIFPGEFSGQVTISNVNAPLQSNGTWWYLVVESNQFQLFWDEALTQPVDGSAWPGYAGGGDAVSVGSAMTINASNITIDTGLGNSWTFDTNGDISFPQGSASFTKGRIQSANGYPTLLGYGSSPEHGGPELDWMNGDNPNDMSNNSVLRNTLYINENGFYVGMNQNNFDVANNFNGSWRFGSSGSLTIPAGDANNIVSGQIFSDNESSFINLDVQFDSDVLGGMRLGTSATKPVDIVTGNGSGYNTLRFDSAGNLIIPGNVNVVGTASGDVTNEGGIPGVSGSQTITAALSTNPIISSIEPGWTVTGNNLTTTTLVTSVVEYSPGFYEITTDTTETNPFWYNDTYVLAGTSGFKTWTFDSVGNLTIPGNISARGGANVGFAFSGDITNITTGSSNVTVTINSNPFPDPVSGQVTITGVSGTTEANDTWWFEAVNYNAFQLYTDQSLTTPVDGTTWTAYAGGGFADNGGLGNISITANSVSIVTTSNSIWTFNSNGSTVFPTLSVDLHNGGVQDAQTLQFGDRNQQAVITGPTPLVNNNAQRLIIQGQRSTGGEGGDVYLWGGDSDVNGGDIKIYAGDADVSGSGGYVNIDGGTGVNGGGGIQLTGGASSTGPGGSVNLYAGNGDSAGTVNIQGGQAGNVSYDGGAVNITGGYGYGNGGQVTITGGQSALGLPGYANVVINAGASGWTFDRTGNLTAPATIISTSVHVTAAHGNLVLGDATATASPGLSSTSSITFTAGRGTTNKEMSLNTAGDVGISGNLGVTGTITALNVKAEWQFSLQTSNFIAVAGSRYGVDTWSADGPVTATLPSSPSNGDAVFFADAGGYAQNGALTIDAGTNTIMDGDTTMTVTTSNQSVGLFWNGRTWRTYNAG